jgi:hypothetical protein
MKYINAIILLILLIACNNSQNNDWVNENENNPEGKSFGMDEIEEAEEVEEKSPCEIDFDKEFAFDNKCWVDQFEVLHKENQNNSKYRFVYQANKSRLIVYRVTKVNESLHKVYETITCETSNVDYLDLNRKNGLVPQGLHIYIKSTGRIILSLGGGCTYFYDNNEKKYLTTRFNEVNGIPLTKDYAF